MGDALLAAAEPRVRRSAAVGAHPLPGDWRVSPQGDLPSVVPLAGAHMLAPPGACPAMVLDGSQPAVTVAPLDSSNLQVSVSCVPLVGWAGCRLLLCRRVALRGLVCRFDC